ncbi:hypothetical protein V7S43_016779 [Phytophthora oleae]|uniref:Uncharacterized protein n=1 Tax=Phytophthora oleae TaxID=2107226 RepID=A0ABD3EUL7_9STRA
MISTTELSYRKGKHALATHISLGLTVYTCRFCSRDCVRAFFAAESDSQELTPSSTSGISHSSQDVLIDLAQGDPEAVEEHPNDVSLVLFANTSCSECSICSQRSGISESFRSTLS